MTDYYLDAGTTYSKIIKVENGKKEYQILPSSKVKELNLTFKKACGHMGLKHENCENEIVALARGCKNKIDPNSTILDVGSRDAKWVKFKNSKSLTFSKVFSCFGNSILVISSLFIAGCVVSTLLLQLSSNIENKSCWLS